MFSGKRVSPYKDLLVSDYNEDGDGQNYDEMYFHDGPPRGGNFPNKYHQDHYNGPRGFRGGEFIVY